MLRRVTAHIWDFSRGAWRVHLLCGHVVVCEANDHCKKVKARHCPSCPFAERAQMADLKNESAHAYEKLLAKERTKRTPDGAA